MNVINFLQETHLDPPEVIDAPHQKDAAKIPVKRFATIETDVYI